MFKMPHFDGGEICLWCNKNYDGHCLKCGGCFGIYDVEVEGIHDRCNICAYCGGSFGVNNDEEIHERCKHCAYCGDKINPDLKVEEWSIRYVENTEGIQEVTICLKCHKKYPPVPSDRGYYLVGAPRVTPEQ